MTVEYPPGSFGALASRLPEPERSRTLTHLAELYDEPASGLLGQQLATRAAIHDLHVVVTRAFENDKQRFLNLLHHIRRVR